MAAVILGMVNNSKHKLTELISLADEQLYAAKNQGRNKYLFERLDE
jgi:PleD family two-component response regulator